MTSLPLSHLCDDYNKFLEFAANECQAKIVRLEEVADIWQGEKYRKSDYEILSVEDHQHQADDVWLIRGKDHRSKNQDLMSCATSSAKLTNTAASSADPSKFLKNGDIVIKNHGAPDKISIYFNLDFESLSYFPSSVVVTKDYTVIRPNSSLIKNCGITNLITNFGGRGDFRRFLMSSVFQNLLLSIKNKYDQNVFSSIIPLISIPVFPLEKKHLLDVLLQTEPDANLARIFEILSTDLKSSKAIDFFSGTETLQMTFGVNENWKVDDIKETVFNDLMNEVSEFLKKNSSHSDPFLIWLRQYHQTANHLKRILQSPKDANMILALQAWIKNSSNRKNPVMWLLNRFMRHVFGDYYPLRKIIIDHCNNLISLLNTLADESEKELTIEVSRSIPLHASTHESELIREELQKRVLSLLDFAKTSMIHADQLHVIPLLLYLVDESALIYVPKNERISSFKEHLSEFAEKSKLCKFAADWCKKIQDPLLDQLLEKTTEIALSLRQAMVHLKIEQLITALLNGIEKQSISKYFYSPYSCEFMTFVADYADIGAFNKVYVPYTLAYSFNSYLPNLENSLFQFTNDSDALKFAVNEIVRGRDAEIHISDPVYNWNPTKKSFNIVIAAPPTHQRIRSAEYSDGETHCVMQSFGLINDKELDSKSHLTPKRALICMTPSFLFRKGETYRARRELIEKNAIQSMIYFPPGIREGVNFGQVLLTLRPAYSSDEPMVMIDASECMRKTGDSRHPILDSKKLRQIISAENHPQKRHLTAEAIRNNDYDLSPGIYLIEDIQELPENHELYELSQLIKPITNISRCFPGDKGIPIMPRMFPPSENLEYTSFNGESAVTLETVNRANGLRRLTRDAFIINSIFSSEALRTCLFKHAGTDIFLRPDTLTFEIDTTLVDPQWLQLALSASSFAEKLSSLTIGTGIPRIRQELLLRLNLAVPKIPEQKLLVKYHKETLLKTQVKELGLEDLIRTMKKEFLDDLRLKKHSISQITNDIKSAIAVVIDELSKKGSISADQIISPRRSINFSNYLLGISQKCGALGKMIEQLTEENKHEPLAQLNLDEAMSEIVSEYKGENFELKFGLDKRSFVDPTTGKSIEPIIRIGKNDFKTLCRNIIDNAKRHAFKGNMKGASLLVDAELMPEEQRVELCFMNNGAPFPKGMDLDRFVIRGEKAGTSGNTGTGGYHIKSIMDHVGGSLDIVTPPFDEYTTEIRLYFPFSHEDTI